MTLEDYKKLFQRQQQSAQQVIINCLKDIQRGNNDEQKPFIDKIGKQLESAGFAESEIEVLKMVPALVNPYSIDVYSITSLDYIIEELQKTMNKCYRGKHRRSNFQI